MRETYITVDHFHLSSMAHAWSFHFWGEMGSFFISKVCVLEL